MATKDFEITQGKTFAHTLRWETGPIKYRPITAIDNTAPVRIHVPAHGAPSGHRATVVSAKGMVQINAEGDPPKVKDYHVVTVIDADTVEFNDVNAADFKAHVPNTGYLRYNTLVDLSGYTARMAIKTKVGGAELAFLSSDPLVGGITLDNDARTIVITMDAADTALLDWARGVYELELVSSTGVVRALLSGNIKVNKEITT